MIIAMRNDKKKWIYVAFLTFFVLVLYQCILNRNEIVMRSLPDEIGAVSFAASLAGYDWSYVLAQANKYYGFGTGVLLTPLFFIFHDPLHLYQALLAGAAIFRTIPVFFCFFILFHRKDRCSITEAAIISAISVMGAPTRSTNIDNEPMMILIGWLIFLMIYLMQYSKGKKQILYSVIVAFILGYSMTVHTRAYLLTITFLFVCLLFQIVNKRSLLNYWSFVTSCLFLFFIFNTTVKVVKDTLYQTDEFTNATLGNSVADVASSSISNLIYVLFSEGGVRAFFSLLFSNISVIYVYYFGIMIIVVISIAKMVLNIKHKDSLDDLSFPSFFAMGVFLISTLGLCVLWIESPVSVHKGVHDLSRAYFYMRYYGNTFGIILFYGMIMLRERLITKRTWLYSILLGCISFKHLIANDVVIAINNKHFDGDWFGYFAPLSLTGKRFGEDITVSYFVVAFAVAVFIHLIFFAIYNYKRMGLGTYTIILIVIIFEYTYAVNNWDYDFSHMNDYYGSINALYELTNLDENVLEDIDRIYYYNPSYGPQFEVQFLLLDKKVISSCPEKQTDDDVILTSSIKGFLQEANMDLEHYVAYMLDENEYIIVNNTDRIEQLASRYNKVGLN